MAWVTKTDGDFSRVRVEVNRILDDEGVQRAAGCVGYALAKNLRGETLGEPENVTRKHGVTSFECYYDSTKARAWNFDEAIEEAVEFILEGTPVRITNRSGPNTQGTRLVEGVGASARVYVDAPDTETRSVTILVNGRVDRELRLELPVGSRIEVRVL